MTERFLDFTATFAGNTLGPVPERDAVSRAIAFCCSARSGFLTYDGAGHAAREAGRLREIGPWSILLADALAGRITVDNVHGFAEHMTGFASRLRAVPDTDLAALDEAQLACVVEFCTFGFAGAWAPKITKAGALFRPKSVPVLDGYVALAFGYARDAFSAGAGPRKQAITRVIKALSAGIRSQGPLLDSIRSQVEQQVPAAHILSDLRLADIIIWTSQDDRMERPGKPLNSWLHSTQRHQPHLDALKWMPL